MHLWPQIFFGAPAISQLKKNVNRGKVIQPINDQVSFLETNIKSATPLSESSPPEACKAVPKISGGG